MKGYLLGRVLLTVTNQPAGAPFVDECFFRCDAAPGVSFRGWAILLKPWRRNRWGEHGGGLAFVIGISGLRPRGARGRFRWGSADKPLRGQSREMTILDECGEAPRDAAV